MYNNNKKNIVIIQMANFQRIVLIIALVLLVVFAIILTYVLYQTNTNQQWPPYIPNCPDYWVSTMDGSSNVICNYNKKNPFNVGSCKNVVDKNVSGLTSCDKYNWATGCDIVWDGITYGVTNPCSTSTTTTTTSS